MQYIDSLYLQVNLIMDENVIGSTIQVHHIWHSALYQKQDICSH